MQPCRYCRQDVDPQARRCPHCRSDLTTVGKLRILQPVVSVLVAVGGFGFGMYERHVAKTSQGELEMEQAALVKVLQAGSSQDLATKYRTDSASEEQLKKELRRNPRNVDARIRLRMKQHARTGANRRNVANKPRGSSRG